MKKEIRLLVENLFDDLYNIDQENDLTIDIADKIYTPEIGDIYYKRKKPYAICCGNTEDFKDNKPRYCLLNFNKDKHSKWCKCKENYKFVKELGIHRNYDVKTNTYLKDIDENGYENTQIIKNHYPINEFPVFNNCIRLGNNVYLPAINELKILRENKIHIKLNIKFTEAWASTQEDVNIAYAIDLSDYLWANTEILGYGKTYLKNCIPFIKID